MAVPMRKAHHFVLNGRTIPGPGAIDLARIHGRTMEVSPDDIVGSRVGLSDVAINLRRSDFTRQERKRPRWHVAWLAVQSVPSDRCPIETRRRARL